MKKMILFVLLSILISAFYIPLNADPIVKSSHIYKRDYNVRGEPKDLREISLSVNESGKVLVTFDGKCTPSVGDRITLAASNIKDWKVNDGATGVEAVNSDINTQTFSHTRMYYVSKEKYEEERPASAPDY